MKIDDYKIASTEVLYILEYLPKNEVEKIPIKFIDFLKANSISNYNPEFDFSSGLDKINLNRKTKSLLAMIYRNYMCSEEEGKEYDEILSQNDKIYKEELNKKYDLDNLLKKQENASACEVNITESSNSLIKHEESFFIKIKNFVLKVFNVKTN